MNSDKGKPKENDVRSSKERQHEQQRLNIETDTVNPNDDDDEDYDNEGGAGLLHQNLSSARSAFQGLRQ